MYCIKMKNALKQSNTTPNEIPVPKDTTNGIEAIGVVPNWAFVDREIPNVMMKIPITMMQYLSFMPNFTILFGE